VGPHLDDDVSIKAAHPSDDEISDFTNRGVFGTRPGDELSTRHHCKPCTTPIIAHRKEASNALGHKPIAA
jgi:hypothetical protein